MAENGLKVAFIGSSENGQNRVVENGLKAQNHSIFKIEPPYSPSRGDIKGKQRFGNLRFLLWFVSVFLIMSASLITQSIINYQELRKCDVIFVPHLADYDFFPAKLISVLYSLPILTFSHMSLYYGLVINFQTFDPESQKASFLYNSDKVIHRLADKVVVLTEPVKNQFSRFYGTDVSKYEIVNVGVEESNFQTTSDEHEEVDVIYWGNFMPYHGLNTILDAAKKLEMYNFKLVGDGDLREEIENRVKTEDINNVEITGRISWKKMTSLIESADIALGTFSDNKQNDINIGTKIAEAAYLEKCIITAQGRGITSIFTHKQDIFLTKPGNESDLACAIEKLLRNEGKRRKIASNAKKVYKENMSPNSIGKRLENIIENLL